MDHPRHHHYNHRRRSHPWRGHPRSDSWKNRSHPSERDRLRDSSPEKYRSRPRQDRDEMCASRPLHPDNPFYHLYLHKDPLGLAIDQRRTDVVIQGAAINVAMFHSHPTTMEKIDTMFLRQQVSYLEHVIKAMKDVITKHQEELQPLDVTVERDTMRQKAALKRKEEFPQEESEKEEGELEEDTPKRKKMKLNTEKRNAVKKPQDPFMGLPISEEEEYKPEIKKNEAKQLPITASCEIKRREALAAASEKEITKKLPPSPVLSNEMKEGAVSEKERTKKLPPSTVLSNEMKERERTKKLPLSPVLSNEMKEKERTEKLPEEYKLEIKTNTTKKLHITASCEIKRREASEKERTKKLPEEYKLEIKTNTTEKLHITASCEIKRREASEKERDKAMRKAKEDERLSNILLDDDFFCLKKEDLIPDFQKKDCQIVTRCAEDSPFVRKYSRTLLKPR